MSHEPDASLVPRPGGNASLVPSGSTLVARALSDLAPATRRVLVAAADEASQADACAVVARHECVPVGHAHPGNPSDLLAYLPFEVAILAGESVAFLAETRLLLPDEIPIMYELTAEEGKSEYLNTYDRALAAGAAFVQWPGRRMLVDTDTLPDALVLARFLRDHPDARGWPAQPPPDRASIHFLVVNDEQGVLGPLTAQIEYRGYRVSTARDGLEALERLEVEPVDVLWTNERMPRLRGSELLARIQGRVRGRIPCVIDSGCHDGWAGRARLAFRCMWIPWDIWDAWAICHEAARLRHAFQYALSPRVLCGRAT